MKVKVISGKCKYKGKLFEEGVEGDISKKLKNCMEKAGVIFDKTKDSKKIKAGKK